VGPTVFEIGYPDRTGAKFRHGDDYWVGDIGPSPNAPSPIWSKHLAYPFEFPSGPNYIVGQSRWTTDWDYVQPIVTDSLGNFNGSTSTITFNLPAAPGAQASFYIALSSDYQGPLIIQVNGSNIAGSTGYFPAYSSSGSGSDTTIRQAAIPRSDKVFMGASQTTGSILPAACCTRDRTPSRSTCGRADISRTMPCTIISAWN
jgi:hypothetical protein